MIRIVRSATTLVLGVLALAASVTQAANEGYKPTNRPAIEREDGKIQITEFFWYGCPHCYKLEPAMKAWLKTLPDDVVFSREAPALNKSWENHSRAFYASELMAVNDKLHEPLFHGIHRDQKPLRTQEQIVAFASEKGIDGKKFDSMMKSFAVQGRMNQARQDSITYRLTGVPAILVNGEYITGPSLAGSNDNVPLVLNKLIEKIRAEKQ